ncbi:MAG: hypothetical protein U0836_26955 [Pirellulales bacterium]
MTKPVEPSAAASAFAGATLEELDRAEQSVVDALYAEALAGNVAAGKALLALIDRRRAKLKLAAAEGGKLPALKLRRGALA